MYPVQLAHDQVGKSLRLRSVARSPGVEPDNCQASPYPNNAVADAKIDLDSKPVGDEPA